jgi:anti-sigma factor RsiW
MICDETRPLLSAYQDGELSADQRAQVAEHLKACDGCGVVYRHNLSLSQQIRLKAPTYTPPESLMNKLQPQGRPNSRAPFGFGLTVGLAAALLGMFLMRSRPTDITAELVSDHVRSLMASHLMDVVSTDRHTVKPWFLGKLDFAPKVPQLRDQGYPLLGGRLDYVNGHTAAALVYGKQKHFINVLILPTSLAGSTSGGSDGYQVVRWTESDLTYWAVSDVPQSDLETFRDTFVKSP